MNAKIAVPVEDDRVFRHFGKATKFRLYTIVENTVKASECLDAGEVEHDELALLLVTHEVNVVICGDIGPGAYGALMAAGIIVLAGVDDTADAAIGKLLDGSLEALHGFANCAHHGSGGCGGHCSGHCGHGGCCH